MATKAKKKPSKKTTPAKLTKAQREALKARKLAVEIQRRTKLFKAASPAQKRVLIAQDVIAQIKANRYAARTGMWAELYNKNGTNLLNEPNPPGTTTARDDAQVQSLFLSGEVATCECCALGGVMMSCTLYNNNQTIRDFFGGDDDVGYKVGNGDKFANGLHRIFSRQQLALIECAFEGGRGGFSAVFPSNDDLHNQASIDPLLENLPRATLKRAVGYADKYREPTKRMIAIMRNIIKNDGTFKP